MLESLIFYGILVGLLYYAITSLLEKLHAGNLTEKPVVITGCDTGGAGSLGCYKFPLGFGHDLALKCLNEGMPIFAGCLTQQVSYTTSFE